MVAIGYARQSRRADLDVALSYETQVAAIRRLAGTDDVEILSDLGRSGGAGKEKLRPGYQTLLAKLEAGELTEIFALNLSRLARSVPELHRIMDLAKAHKCKVTTSKEGTLDPTTTTGRLTFGIFALLAEFVRDLAVDAALENAAARRDRGDVMGRPAYGTQPGQDVQVVIEAFRTAGSWSGAARILNAAGVPTALGRRWKTKVISQIVERHAPELMPVNPGRGVAAGPAGGFRLARLLRCPYDDRFLTGGRNGRSHAVRYRCAGADGDSSHPRPSSISETLLLAWVEKEWALYREPEAPTSPRFAPGRDVAAELASLSEARLQVAYQAIDGGLTREQARAKRAEIDLAIRALAPAPKVPRPRSTYIDLDIDWMGWPPEHLVGGSAGRQPAAGARGVAGPIMEGRRR
jgi:DNA invertase Pin-like site-specific DNA recombinase